MFREIFPAASESNGRKRGLRFFIITAVLVISWVPGGVALAMLLTGNAGD